VMEATQETIAVGLGEVHVTNNPSAKLACFGLGSCIAFSVYDSKAKVGGMAHIVLPDSNHTTPDKLSAKFADVAIPLLLQKMSEYGASKSRLVIKIAGGAQMFRLTGCNDTMNIGERNLAMVHKILVQEGLHLAAADTGGNGGRTMWLAVGSGKVTVRTLNREVNEL